MRQTDRQTDRRPLLVITTETQIQARPSQRGLDYAPLE